MRAAEGRLARRLVAGRRRRGRAGRLAVRGRARAWPDRERADTRPGAWSAAVAVRLAAW